MAAAHPGQDCGLPGVVTHSRLQRPTSVRFRVGIVLKKRLRGRYRLGHWPVVLFRTETAQCTVRPTLVRAGKSCGSLSERCRPWSWSLKRCCGKWMSPLKVTPRRVCFGWEGDHSWVRLVTVQKPVRSPKITSAGTSRRARNSSRKFRWMVYSIPSARRLSPWWWGSEKWFWTITREFIYRHHVVPRVKVCALLSQIEDEKMVKRSIEQNLRMKNCGARNGNCETSATAVVNNQRVKQREQRSLGDGWQWKANGQCSKGDSCSFRHDEDKRAKSTQPNPSLRSSTQQNVKNASRTRSPRGRSPSGKMGRLPCKDHLKGTCTTPFFEKGHPPECLSYMSENGCKFEEKCSYAHRQTDEQPSKRSQKNGDKSAVAILKNTRQLGCVFQDMEPPKSTSFLRKSSDIRKPIRCVQFTKASLRHANIRYQKSSFGMICPGDHHQRNPNAPKFEDRSLEETEWKDCAN